MIVFIWFLFTLGSFAVASIIDSYYPGTFKLILLGIAGIGTAFLFGALAQDLSSKSKKK